jgi:hypothetical protein
MTAQLSATDTALLRFLRDITNYFGNGAERNQSEGSKRLYRQHANTMRKLIQDFYEEDAIILSTCCALHLFVRHHMYEYYGMFKQDNRAFNALDMNGDTPLMIAASIAKYADLPNLTSMQTLIQHGSDKNVRSVDGKSALGTYYESLSDQRYNIEFERSLDIADPCIIEVLMPDDGMSAVDKKHKAIYEKQYAEFYKRRAVGT